MIVVRGEFTMDDPWSIPRHCNPVRLRLSTDGTVPRLSTTVSAYYDHEFLSLVFSSADDLIVASILDRDGPIYQQDVVEAFLAPEQPGDYFEIEVSPKGTVFDARISSPDGVRATMKADVGWDCRGLVAAVKREVEVGGTLTVDTLMRVPFAALGRTTPLPGEEWLGNFYRIDRHPELGDEYSAWRPTGRVPADFHVTAAFGRLVFGG